MKKINYRAIILYYMIAVACRYFTNRTDILKGLNNEYLRSTLTGAGPAIGAVIVFALFNIKPIMSLKGNYKKILLPILIYYVLPVVLISIVLYYTKGTIPWMAVSSILIYGLLEEIGWRGFLYQELKGLPIVANILIVATLWFLWHLNFEFSASNVLFYALLILGSWGIGKVADSTNSLIAVSAFHSLNNFFPKLDPTRISILSALLIIWILSLIIRKKMLAARAGR